MPITNEIRYHDSGSGVTYIITTYEDGEEIIVEE